MALGDEPLAQRLRTQAQTLQQRFERAFWCDEIGSYALALDGAKQPCMVRSSNAGHALWSGIATPAHAARIARDMVGEDFHNGWGIRTIAHGQPRYNPMSYHNGSVWPHDNALIAAGMARYGHTAEAMHVLSGLFDASLQLEEHRLPELFCGFPRRDSGGPVLYPVACSPQAWAAAAVFSVVQSCLGLEIDALRGTVSLQRPRLPPFIDWLRLHRLQVGSGSLDLLIQRYANNVGVEAVRKQGDIELSVVI
jgi:glycogen debranching enzyme